MSAVTKSLAAVLPNMLAMALRPVRFIAQLGAGADEAPAVSAAGRWPVLSAALAWAAFCLSLYGAGHCPSVTLLPVPRAHYYLFQAIVLVPLLQLLWWLLSRLACRWGNVPVEKRARAAAALAYAYATPLLLAFIVPDVVVYLAMGHEKMGRALLLYAPIAPLWTWALGSLVLRKIGGTGTARSWLAMFGALLCQAFLGSIILR